jgi:AraC family transcriptional regulator
MTREETMKGLSSVLVLLVALVGATSWAQDGCTVEGAPADTSAQDAEKAPQVQLKEDTAFVYCALEMTGSYDQHEAAFMKLYQESMKQEIYGGLPFGIYWNSPADTPAEKLSWDIGFILSPGKTPQDPLKAKRWDFTTMASLMYRGAFGGETMNAAYGQVYKWIAENGYQAAGPMMEVFLNAPSPDESGALYGAVEIVVPIVKVPPAKDAKAK